MNSPKPSSRFYVLAAIVIAVVIWMVMGAPENDPAYAPLAIARTSVPHR